MVHHRDELLEAILLDHDERPRNFVVMEEATHIRSAVNPICGDHYTVFLDLDDSTIRRVSFQGRGCTISKASASIMTTLLSGKSIEEVVEIRNELSRFLVSTDPKPALVPVDLDVFGGVRSHPSRIACVMLPWNALAEALGTG
jgi:nitrogen fixation NifU-like protein